ncbi:hypothetical protein CN934_03270 [Ensifer sp. MMN_5]|nr:hypothetical protein CN934_03270 [Ensifer sp. MMN_5]
MRFLPPDDDVVLYEQGFEADLLGRERVGKTLSALLERIDDPLVVALDGRWGTGKTYFLKRWVGAHQSQNGGAATTVYFDAFAHDYLSDPLVALVGALGDRVPASKQSKLKRVQKAAIKFMKPLARMGLAAASFGATEALNDLGDVVAEVVKDEASAALDVFWEREAGRRAAMEEFRAAITSLIVTKDGAVSPLIIVIDELDRCRPDYALEVLEVIKHFFSVRHVHFILGVNLSALENSVKVRYGDGIDAGAYLKKFISLSLNLPDTVGNRDGTKAIITYAQYLAETMEIPEPVTTALIEHLAIISKVNSVSIRDVGKIMSVLALLPEEAAKPNVFFGWREVMLTLVVTRVIRPQFYGKFLRCEISADEIAEYFGTTESSRTRQINGVSNDEYDHPSYIRYLAWLYLCNEGDLGDNEDGRYIVKFFDDYGRLGRPRELPMRVYGLWLDLFRIP